MCRTLRKLRLYEKHLSLKLKHAIFLPLPHCLMDTAAQDTGDREAADTEHIFKREGRSAHHKQLLSI